MRIKYIMQLFVSTLCIALFTNALLKLKKQLPLRSGELSLKLFAEPNAPSNGKLTGSDWIQRVFSIENVGKIKPVESIKAEVGAPCIINSPEVTMANPYLGDTFDECVIRLKTALVILPDARSKPVLFIAKGMGGGKTCLCETSRRYVNAEMQNSVAIAITFNLITQYQTYSETFINDIRYLNVNIILSIIARIAAVVYEESFEVINDIIQDNIGVLNLKGLRGVTKIGSFTASFIQHIINDIEKSASDSAVDGTYKIKNFVLIVDEVMKVCEKLEKKYKTDNTAADAFEAAMSALNFGLLTSSFKDSSKNNKVNTALIVSSLDIAAAGVTKSDRAIVILPTPKVIPSRDIVDLWWLPNIPFKIYAFDKRLLETIASSVNTLPRLIQFANDYIKAHLVSSETKIEASFVNGLYQNILSRISSEYSLTGKATVDYNVLFALYFGDSITLTDNVMQMITKSILTNAVEFFDLKEEFSPEASVVMLASIGRFYPSDEFLEPIYCLREFFNRVVDAISALKAKGDALEVAASWWLRCRMAAAHKVGMKSISLNRLFALSNSTSLPDILLPKRKDYFVDKTTKTKTNEVLLPVISDDIVKYANKFNQIHLTEDHSLVMFESVTNQNYDQLIIAKVADSTNSDECFVIFIDEKSSNVYFDSNKPKYPYKLDLTQFNRVKDVVECLRVMRDDEHVTLSPASQALINGSYRFIYLTTHLEVDSSECTEQDKQNVIVIEKDGAEKFFGFVFDFYQAARVALQKTDEKEKRKETKILPAEMKIPAGKKLPKEKKLK